MAHAGLRARALAKRFGRVAALDGVDLDVAPGEILGLTGSNGAGKTTVVRIFATLLHPDAGAAWVDGADVVGEAATVRRRIGVAVVNERGMYWRLTGFDNLVFFARAAGLSKRAARAAAEAALAEVGLAAIGSRPVSTYSAGQRQRLALARATSHLPSALLLDEPLRGLDEEGMATVLGLLRRHAQRGAAVLVAAPALAELGAVCDRVVVLERGCAHLTTGAAR